MFRNASFLPCIAILLSLLTTWAAQAGDKAPLGPPWEVSLAAAQAKALANGTPIFVYFTKTICPHCEPVEKGVLPSPGLKPGYDAVAWLFNTRDFSGSPKDKAAELIELRFSVSSYPQLLLVDPESLQVIGSLGRTEEALLSSFTKTKVRVSDAEKASQRLKQAEAAIAALRKADSVVAAKKALLEGAEMDVVVQFVALKILAEKSPGDVTDQAEKLLQVQHDQFRYLVCDALAKSRTSAPAKPLATLLANPGASLNPNVVRIHAAKALAKCGTHESVAALAPFATTGDYNNGLTYVSIEALAEIAGRDPRATAAVIKTLEQALPKPSATADKNELARNKSLTAKIEGHLAKLNEMKE